MPSPYFLSWVKQRHRNAAAHDPPRPESSFKGTVDAMLHWHFKQEQNWLIIPEIILREVMDDKDVKPIPDVPELDDDAGLEEHQSEEHLRKMNEQDSYGLDQDEEDVGDTSLNSQGDTVQGSRIDALHPDFGISHGRSELFSDRTHLYVEVKNGSVPSKEHTTQIVDYIGAIANSIPEDFKEDVVLMLVDANWTYIWRITPTTRLNSRNLWSKRNVQVGKTGGYKMGRIFEELAGRV